MEILLQLAMILLVLCAVVFIWGFIQLLTSKGKSKTALRMVLISSITACVIVVIGFGTCLYALSN
ncbi:hypothetical protein [Flavobacterium sp. XGLA_31]|uniref:hypothetical protein n=1 Tax=Flavobacterium sp. XGLA_31 TaxID=3447666 RepID=UPI003F3C3AA3